MKTRSQGGERVAGLRGREGEGGGAGREKEDWIIRNEGGAVEKDRWRKGSKL